MPMRKSIVIRHALLATTFLGIHSIALAQSTSPANSQSKTSNAVEPQANQNTIVITAEKRPELLQNVPIQVDVLTGKTLGARQIKMTKEIARTIPNLTIEKTDTYSNSVIVLRGVSQAANSDSPVA